MHKPLFFHKPVVNDYRCPHLDHLKGPDGQVRSPGDAGGGMVRKDEDLFVTVYSLPLNLGYNFFIMEGREILRAHIAKTVSLTDEQFDYCFSHFKPHSFKKGQIVVNQGDAVDQEYFVVSGCLKAFFINDEVKMYILQFAMPGWWTSDYNALYSNTRATINVDCIADAELLSISNADREKLCSELHPVEYFFRWRTNKGYVASQKRLLSFMNNDVKKRYEDLLALYPQLYNLVPKHLIAAYLGVSRETLSRLYNH